MRIGHFILAHYPRPHRRKCRKALAQRPLRRRPLHIACAHIIHDGVAEHMFHRLAGGNLIPRLANHHRKFCLVVHLLAGLRQNYIFARPYHRRRKHDEYRRNLLRLCLRFLRMLRVVHAYAKNPRRSWNRRQQLQILHADRRLRFRDMCLHTRLRSHKRYRIPEAFRTQVHHSAVHHQPRPRPSVSFNKCHQLHADSSLF